MQQAKWVEEVNSLREQLKDKDSDNQKALDLMAAKQELE